MIEGLFSLLNFSVNIEVKMGSVSIKDVRLQRGDKVKQIVKEVLNPTANAQRFHKYRAQGETRIY